MLGRAVRKLLSTRCTSSGGAGAPPPPTESRLEVSRRAKSGHSSRSQDCVGTPTKLRDALALDQLERPRRDPTCASSRASLPAPKHESITGDAARHVEERHDQDEAGRERVLARRALAHRDVDRRCGTRRRERRQHRAMRRDGALRVAGGARRVEDRRVEIGVQRRPSASPRRGRRRPPSARRRPAARPGVRTAITRSGVLREQRRDPRDALGVGDHDASRRSRRARSRSRPPSTRRSSRPRSRRST